MKKFSTVLFILIWFSVFGEANEPQFPSKILSHIQNSTITMLVAQKLYGDEILGITGELDYNALITQIDTSLTNQEDTTQVANLLLALIHRDGLSTLESFDSNLLESVALQEAFATNGITYSVDSQRDISGSYGDTIEGSNEGETINSAVSGEVYGGAEDNMFQIKYALNSNRYQNDKKLILKEVA